MLAKCAVLIAALELAVVGAAPAGAVAPSGISPRSARVVAGRFRVVDFDIDTGIR